MDLTNYFSIYAVLSLSSNLFICEQINSRFKSKEVTMSSYNCIFGVQIVNGVSAKDYLQQYDLLESVSKGTNFTLRRVNHEESNGKPFKNGSYTGIIGQIQRHEIDVAYSAVRPDSILFDPVLVGPPLLAADAVIVSAKTGSKTWIVDTIDMVESFSAVLYAYLAISIYITVTLLTLCSLAKDRIPFISKWLNNLWKAFEPLVNQENYSTSIWSSRILWLFYCISVFITLLGYLLNLMSTEMVAESKKPMINDVRDLLSPSFANVTPVIFKQGHMYNLLRSEYQVHPNSQVGQLYAKMLLTANKSLLELDLYDKVAAGNAMKDLMLNDVAGGKAALIIPAVGWSMIEPIMCQMQANVTRKIHTSTGTLLQGTFNTFFSKRINSHLRRLLEYRFRNIVEFGILRSGLDHSAESMFSEIGMELTFDRFKCMIEDCNKYTDTKPASALKVGNTSKTWMTVGCVLSLATIGLLIEVIVGLFQVKLNRWITETKRRRRKTLRIWRRLGYGLGIRRKRATRTRNPRKSI